MEVAIHSLIDLGLHRVVVDVEHHLSNNLPAIFIVGVANRVTYMRPANFYEGYFMQFKPTP